MRYCAICLKNVTPWLQRWLTLDYWGKALGHKGDLIVPHDRSFTPPASWGVI